MKFTKTVSSNAKSQLNENLRLQRFARSLGERGPHEIPRQRQVSNQFHRIFSVKAGCRIAVAESQLEANAIFWAEGNPDIISLCEQPIRILGNLGKRPYYTLDLGVKYKDGTEVFFEIKPESHLITLPDGRKAPEHWNAIEKWCSVNGHECDFLTDKTLDENSTLIRNWHRLLPFVRTAHINKDDELKEEVVQVLTDYPGLPHHEISHHTIRRSDQEILAITALLLHQGNVQANLNKASFTRHTPLYLV